MKSLGDCLDVAQVNLVIDLAHEVRRKLSYRLVFQYGYPPSKNQRAANLDIEVVVEALTSAFLVEGQCVLAAPNMGCYVRP
jgi:hypothetical protein